MQTYSTEQIRNVVLLGHGGCGKTTLVEALAYVAGVTTRMGKVSDGNTISDFDKEEAKRQFSISASVIPLEYEGVKYNFIDTPGFFDFSGEVAEAMSVADAALIVINGKAGIEVGTIKAWELCEQYHMPRMFYVTGMDDDNASYRTIILELEKRYGKCIAPYHLPIRENEKFVGFVNVVKMKGRRFTENGKYVECDIPDYSEHNLNICRTALLEAVAETSDEYMERYFAGEDFTYEEIAGALRTCVQSCDMVPVLMGTGINAQGSVMALQIMQKYFPAPDQCECSGTIVDNDADYAADYDDSKPVSVRIFKTLVDPFIGKYSLFKVCSGVIRSDSALINVNKESEIKLSRLYVLRGKEAIEVSELHAGDIGAVAKLADAETGDTLAAKGLNVEYPAPEFPMPYCYLAYETRNKGEDDKAAQALSRIMEEDKTIRVVSDTENHQSLIYGVGSQQLDVVVGKIASRYKIEIDLKRPRVAFRETLRGKVKVQGKYKKQSGGHGQYGDVTMEFEPSGDMSIPYIFEEKIVGGVVPRNFFPAVEKGIQESVQRGPVAGYPFVGLKATLVFGSYHPVDSSEMAFKTAASMAFKNACEDPAFRPVLLEPIADFHVKVPDEFAGDVMGDLNKRRGRVLGMNAIGNGYQQIEAEVPMSEIIDYSTSLSSMTGGAGTYAYEFARYEQAPADVQKREQEAKAKV